MKHYELEREQCPDKDEICEYSDDLACCQENGCQDISIDTASSSLSLTQESSLLSSISNDTLQEDVSPHFWNEESLRHRRSSGLPADEFSYCDQEDFHTYTDDDDRDDDDDSLEEEEEIKMESKRRRSNKHDASWVIRLVTPARVRASQRHKLYLFLLTLLLAGFVWSLATSNRFSLGRYGPRWQLPSRKRIKTILARIAQQPVTKALTVRLRGQDVDLLHRSLDQHAHCDIVTQVQIDWTSQQDQLPDTLLNHPKVEDLKANSEITTEAVFLLDEGLQFSCAELDLAWNEWKQDPSRLVGFLPVRRPGEKSYSLVLDSAVLFHRVYLPSLNHATLSTACQNVAVSAWITALSLKSPIAMAVEPTLLTDLPLLPSECHRQALYATGLSSLPVEDTVYLGDTL